MDDNKTESNELTINEEIEVERDIDIKTGIITERYYVPGENIRFNLDGLPFTFEGFALEIQRKEEKILGIFIDVDSEVPENVDYLLNLLGSPENYEDIETEYYSFRLALKKDIIEQYVNPKMKTVEDSGLEKLFALQDESTGQNILTDFYYYEFESVKGA